MNKNNTLLRSAASLGLIAAIVFSILLIPARCYATEATPNLDVKLTLPATTVDFTVNGSVELTGTAKSTALTGNSITVTNNTIGKISLDSIAYDSAVDSWTLVADTTDFKAMAWNQKKFSLLCGTHDFSTGALEPAEVIGGNGASSGSSTSKEYSFSGHTGASTTAVGDKTTIAKMVVTVSAVTQEPAK